MIAQYTFENGTVSLSAGTIVDSSGNGNNATAIGAPVYNSGVPANPIPQTGDPNLVSLGFGPGFGTGASDGITFNYAFPFETDSNATLEFYIDPSSTASEQDLFWTTTGGGDTNRFNIGIGGGGGVFMDYRSADGSLNSIAGTTGGVITAGQWNFVAIVKSGNDYSIYVNDLAPVTGTGSLPLPTSLAWTFNGRDVYNGTACCQFSGLLDNIRLSDQALTTGQFLEDSSAVPEPGSFVLSGLSMILFGWLAFMRQTIGRSSTRR
ncbi:MAG TPA: LamG-like jellyroll fold domain-containing protein [Bryobacteraceae bacterium]|jgi:hypothetical protein|nr:LamG-like jellyroll fold domain-containing protein [Bryobacteraceae bacterium]